MVSRKAHNLKTVVRFDLPQQVKNKEKEQHYVALFLCLREVVNNVRTDIKNHKGYVYIPDLRVKKSNTKPDLSNIC